MNARRKVQEGDEFYKEGKYTKAIDKYEKALSEAPDLTTGHHNLAIASYQAFQPGIDTPANLALADKAAEHFQVYLESHPDDEEIISLLTRVWLNTERYDDAESYWLGQLQEEGETREILERLSTISRQSGDFDSALKWDYKRADAAQDDEHKKKAYLDIANLQYSRLTKPDLVDAERIQVADSGIAALTKAIELDPDNPNLYSLMGTLYQFRALSHYTSWARVTDSASQRYFQVRRNEIVEAAKEKAKKDDAAAGQKEGGDSPAEPKE